MEKHFIGIEIGGTKLQIVAGAIRGGITERRRFAVDPARGAGGIRAQLQDGLATLRSRVSAEAIGVGFGGPVDWRSGKICRSHQISGWSEFDLASWIRQQWDLPIIVDNDANVAALGEAWHGAGRAANPVFYVTLGSGAGGGFIVDGEIYHGAPPGEAEIGHIRLDKNGQTLEERCSGWAVDRRIRNEISVSQDGPLAQLAAAAPGGEARFLGQALAQKDALAEKILNDVADDLGFGLSHATHLFHPQTIVLGGGLSLLGEPLRAAVERRLRGYIMEAFQPGPTVALAQLAEDAVPIGALELARSINASGAV